MMNLRISNSLRWYVGLALSKNANKSLIAKNDETSGEETEEGEKASHLIEWKVGMREGGGDGISHEWELSLWEAVHALAWRRRRRRRMRGGGLRYLPYSRQREEKGSHIKHTPLNAP